MDLSTKRLPCDQCHDRRVRCPGYPGQPCSVCTKSHLICTRNKVRRKRGPKKRKKSSDSQHCMDGMASRAQGDPLLVTSMSGSNVNIAWSGDGSSILGPTASDVGAVEVALNPQATSLQHGRGQFRNEGGLHQHVTVNELADFILGDDRGTAMLTDSDLLLGFRMGTPASLQTFSPTSTPTAATWNGSKPNSESGALTSAMRDGLNECTPDTSWSLPAPLGTSVVLDGTALALATGMPLHYGPEMTQCVEVYFTRLYHVLPIIHEGQFRRLLASPSQLSTTDRGLFLAFCAATVLRSSQLRSDPAHAERKEVGRLFLEQHLRLRSDIDYMEGAASSTIVATFLVHVAFACLGKNRSARHYLREAIGKALDLGLQRRTLALMFVTERATGIIDNSDPLLLREHPYLPDLCFDEQDRTTLQGFQCLFGLFALLDQDVISYWCSTTPVDGLKPESIRLKLYSAQAALCNARFEDKNLNDFQRADVLVTQQWLRLIFWQIAMRLGFLSSWSENPAFSYNYPVELGKNLCAVLRSVPPNALLVHHFSIYPKIFEVAYSLMDTLVVSGNREEGPGVNELKELFGYLSTSPVTSMTYCRILMEKDQHTDGPPANRS